MENYELGKAIIIGLIAVGVGLLFLRIMWRRYGEGLTFREFVREINRPF